MHPLAIRYPRAGKVIFEQNNAEIALGKWEVLHSVSPSPLTILAVGERCITAGQKVVKDLQEKGLDASLVNARFVKPLDEALLRSLSGTVITIEDNVRLGGFGNAVNNFVTENQLPVTVKTFAYRDEFIVQGGIAQLQSKYGVGCIEIEKYAEEILQK